MIWYYYSIIKGNVNDDVGVYYEEGTTVEFGCGVTLMGEFYYFGGYESNKRQVILYYNIFQ